MNDKRSKYVFPEWSNKLPRLVLLGLISVLSFVVLIVWYWFSPKNLNVGYMPEQPIPYSHRLHAGELGIDCRYCHSTVEKSGPAGIPSTETCLNCHDVIKTDSPHIKKLHESAKNNEPIEWVKVHQLPDYAFFNHSAHVTSGVSCVTCHGRVDQMDVVQQVQPLSMSWCLECHRSPDKNIRPKSEVTNMSWSVKDPESLGKELRRLYQLNPREDCNTCHR